MEYNKMAMLFYFGFVDMSEISKIFEENYKFSVNHEILHDFYLKKILSLKNPLF